MRIATRKSKLALWQANHVANLIQKIYPDIVIEIRGFTTKGDKITDQSLSQIGGKGLFIKELEVALQNGEADIAVHSLKDIPAKLSDEFTLAAILPREDANDAFISNKYTMIDRMPHGTIIGTSSIRRASFLKKYYPHLESKLLRGNVDTRLKKLDNNEYDAIILAAAGLKRLGLDSRIKELLDMDKFIPAISQGAIGIEIIANNKNLRDMLFPLNDKNTYITVECEREVGFRLGASCSLPIAVHAKIIDSQMTVRAMLLDEDGKICYYSERMALATKYLELAKNCADDLIMQGAAEILEKYK